MNFQSHRTLRRSLLLPTFLLGLFATASLSAQPSDVRISPPDRSSFVLADDARIQSAASGAHGVLVAWGATTPDSASHDIPTPKYHNELFLQCFNQTAPTAGPTRLHSDAARPYGAVAVVDLRDRFLVLWNDRRDAAAGIYARAFDATGAALASEYRLVPGGVMQSDTAVWLDTAADRYTLTWGDTRGTSAARFYRVHLDQAGTPLDSITEIVQANFDDDITNDAFPGAHITKGTGRLRFVHADGRIDVRPVAAHLFSAPHYLNADTSIAVLGIDSTSGQRYISFYRSVFDDTEIRRVNFTLPTSNYATTPVALTRDSSGGYQVFYDAMRSSGGGVYISISGVLVRARLADDGRIADTAMVAYTYQWTLDNSRSSYANGRLDDHGARWGDRNATHLYYTYTNESSHAPFWDLTSSTTTRAFTLDGFGNVYVLDPAVASLRSHDIRGRVGVNRRSVPDSSAVRVAIDSTTTIDASVAITPTPQYRAQREPAFADVAGGPLVVWSTDSVTSPFATARISVAGDLRSDSVPGAALSVPQSYRQPHEQFDVNVHRSGVGGRVWIDYASLQVKDNGMGGTYPSTNAAILLPVDTGWIASAIFTRSFDVFTVTGSGYCPDRDETVHVIASGTGTQVVALAASGTVNWRDTLGTAQQAAIAPRAVIVPLGRQEFLAIAVNTATHIKSGKVAERVRLPATARNSEACYLRMRDKSFVRYYPADGIDSATGRMRTRFVAFETFDFGGTLRQYVRLASPGDEFDLSVYQNAADSLLYVCWGSESGVHLSVLDAELNVGLTDSTISRTHERAIHPTCFVNDGRLVAAWEDYRNGDADIYGTMLRIDPRWGDSIRIVRSGDGANHGNDSLGHDGDSLAALQGGQLAVRNVFPLPANDWLRLDVSAVDDDIVTVDVIDMAGRRVSSSSALAVTRGRSTVHVPTDVLHPGAYTIVLHAESGAIARARAIVMH